jgi:predicted amidohydrolase YtcJ
MRGASRAFAFSPIPWFLLITIVGLTAQAIAADSQKPADVIFVKGDVYMGVDVVKVTGDPDQPWSEIVPNTRITPRPRVQALAVRDGRIVATGTNAKIKKLKGKHTEVVDLGGHFVMPGFNDAHAHLANGGIDYLHVELAGSKSLAEMQQRIAAGTPKIAPGEWIIGRGWDHTLWPGAKLPTRQDVDPFTGDHPAIFQRIDGHIALLNFAGLKAMGITRQTPDSEHGKIDRDASGDPTGIVREKVKDDILARLPKPTLAQRRRGIELALAEAARWGVTSVQDSISVEDDPAEWNNFLVYEDLEREGKLTARVSAWLPFMAPLDLLEQHRAHHEVKDPLLHTGMLKAYLDGALGSRTAALLEPYADDPGNKGILRYDEFSLTKMAVERARAAFQLGFHAIGDAAVQQALEVFSEVARDGRERGQTPPAGYRFRIEHDQVITPEQVRRFAALGVIASVQPCHLLTDMNWAEARLGEARAKTSYPWRDFLDKRVVLAFGTDFPVEPINPFRNVYAAITRKNQAGTREYFSEEKITIHDAIAAYTTGAAFAEHEERDKGMLEPGMLADLVVLDRDITKIPPEQILNTKVLRTVVGGKTVYKIE